MLLAVAAGMLQSILLMAGKSTWQLYLKAGVLVASVVGNLVLVPRFGLAGAAATWVGVVVLDSVIAGLLVHRGLRLRLYPLTVVRFGLLPLVVFGGFGGVLAWSLDTGPGSLLVFLGGCVLVYVAALWLLRNRLDLAGLRGPLVHAD